MPLHTCMFNRVEVKYYFLFLSKMRTYSVLRHCTYVMMLFQ